MAVAQEEYVSEYGWVMTPPAGWEPVPNSQAPVLAAYRPTVFSSNDDPDLSLTWMVAGHPIQEDRAQKFLSVTRAPDATAADLLELAPTIFPTIGKVDSCELVQLADGSRAIEVIETYGQEHTDEPNNGYQLIWPMHGREDGRTFQRICFYAPAEKFAENLPEVRRAARSFYYMRPYGWVPPEPEGL